MTSLCRENRIVVGLDPSTKFGLAAVQSVEGALVALPLVMCTVTNGKLSGLERAMAISDSVLAGIDALPRKPDLAVIEGYAFGNTFSLATLVEIGTLVRVGVVSRGIKLGTMAPNALKKWVTGKGTAKKDMMLLEVYKRFGIEAVDDNQADAVGLATAGLAYLSAIKCNASEVETVSSISILACKNIATIK